MKSLTLENIEKVCGGVYYGPGCKRGEVISSITTDSRVVQPGALFAAIVGERVDGHQFIPEVMEKGALASLSERMLSKEEQPYILVDSTLEALKRIAEFYLSQLQVPVVGITGSVGKTSTKEMTASVLSQKFCTLKTKGNHNNELGLPLTVFRLKEEDEMAVLEMGISDFGEMSRLGQIARPDTCVITNIGPCHLEFLGDRDGVFRAKTEIFDYVKKGGHVILNGEDDKLVTVTEVQGKKPIFYGLRKDFPVYADHIQEQGLKGIACRIHLGAEAVDVQIPLPGRHMIFNALAAAAVGMVHGLDPLQIKAGLEALKPLGGRFRMVETEKLLIVDDCYNASPVSMKASLDVLKDAKGRKVAVLGDMGELGADEEALHREVGRHAANAGIDLLLCAGPLSAHMAEAASRQRPALSICHKNTLSELLPLLEEKLLPGDTVLVKASHFMKFEEAVKALERW